MYENYSYNGHENNVGNFNDNNVAIVMIMILVIIIVMVIERNLNNY